jgi:hypothetical protein
LRRELKLLVCLVVLGAVGFASASIVSGANASSAETTVTATTATPSQTVTVTTTNTVVRRVPVKKRVIVTLCHRTAAGRFLTMHVPLHVSLLAAHLRHGDLTGKCTAAKVRLMKIELRAKRG